MGQDRRKSFRIGFDRWGGMVAALLGGSLLLHSVADIFTPDSSFWRMAHRIEQGWWFAVLPFLFSLAIYGLLLVVGLRSWRMGQREALRRLPPKTFGLRQLKLTGMIVVALAAMCASWFIWLMVLDVPESAGDVPYSALLAVGFVLDALLLAGGYFRILWAKAGLSRNRRAGIAEGVFGICVGVVLIGLRYWPEFLGSFGQVMVVGLAGGVVALRSFADALLLFHKRPAPD